MTDQAPTTPEFCATDLLAPNEDQYSVAAMAIAVETIMPAVLQRIGQLMLNSEDEAATNLRDHAQMLPSAVALLNRLHEELEQ